MSQEEPTTYKVVADVIVSPTDSIVIGVGGETAYVKSVSEENRIVSKSDIADFIFTDVDTEESKISVESKDLILATGESVFWRFTEEGELIGPGAGYIKTPGLLAYDGVNLNLVGADENVVLSSNSGVYLHDDESENNRVATLGDIGVETSYEVQGGTAGTQPTFTGDPLFEASYVRMSSNLVHFTIQVDMDNITNFGTGQYYVTLPFPSKYGHKFRDGCLHDADTGITYHISGHVDANSDELWLFTTDIQGNRLYDFLFAQGEPVTLTTADNFHIAGAYIATDEG